MRFVLTRASHTHHMLTIVRDDGTHEELRLETKTFLIHDLLHYAIESLAHVQYGVWGSLAAGKTFAELNAAEAMNQLPEVAELESIAGAFTNIVRGKVSDEKIIAGIQNIFEAKHTALPTWLTPQFVSAVRERYRQLVGHWNSLEIGDSMDLPWSSSQ